MEGRVCFGSVNSRVSFGVIIPIGLPLPTTTISLYLLKFSITALRCVLVSTENALLEISLTFTPRRFAIVSIPADLASLSLGAE